MGRPARFRLPAGGGGDLVSTLAVAAAGVALATAPLTRVAAAALAAAQTTPAAPAAAPAVAPPPRTPLFSDAERSAIVDYWSAPGRYRVSAPRDVAKNGPWQVRLTPDGSTWLWNYQHVVKGPGKAIPPTEDAHAAAGSPEADWERWVTARVAYDRWVATNAATAANAAASGAPLPPATPPPPLPGPIPASLLAACGDPPPFAKIVTPLQYTITFDGPADAYTYVDNPKMRDRYAYYRFPDGTVSYGQRLKDMAGPELDSLFRKAGFTPEEERIFTAVSGLEGGFDTINTYDTGYVSVGFIQFITLDTGREDLSRALAREKTAAPAAFQADFRRFGIDIQPGDDTLTVVDPATGAELVGRDAVLKVIEDKRLTAIFQRAGRRSEAFRVAQIEEARADYWPAEDPVQVTLPDGTQLAGKVGDVIHSEAGLATLLDRKVNTGHLGPLDDVVARVIAAHHGKTLADAAPYERDIVVALKYRSDFLANHALGQPGGGGAPPAGNSVVAAAATVPTAAATAAGASGAGEPAPGPASATALSPITPTPPTLPVETFHDYELKGGKDAVVSAPFQLVQNEVLLQARINGRGPYTFVLDTGAVNVVTPEAAAAMRLKADRDTSVSATGVGEKSIAVRQTNVKSVEIGGAKMKDQRFFILPLPYSLTNGLGVRIDGLLGYELLQRFAVQIDYVGKVLRIADGATFHYSGDGMVVPFFLRDRHPVVFGSIDGLPGTFQVDTGDAGALQLFAPFVATNNLVKRYDARLRGTLGEGVGGTEAGYITRTRTLKLGGVEVHDLVTELSTGRAGLSASAADAGNVGTEVFKQFTVTFDYPHRTLYFERNANYGARESFSRTGVMLDRTPEGLVVVDVLSGTPGDRAGLRPGDQVLKIEDRPASDLTESDVYTYMRSPGKTLRLRLRRDSKEFDATLRLRDLI